MIFAAKKGDEEIEAKRLSRRGFLRMMVGTAAAAAVPTKTYAFFGNILRTPTSQPLPAWLMVGVAGLIPALLIGMPAGLILGKSNGVGLKS